MKPTIYSPYQAERFRAIFGMELQSVWGENGLKIGKFNRAIGGPHEESLDYTIAMQYGSEAMTLFNELIGR